MTMMKEAAAAAAAAAMLLVMTAAANPHLLTIKCGKGHSGLFKVTSAEPMQHALHDSERYR